MSITYLGLVAALLVLCEGRVLTNNPSTPSTPKFPVNQTFVPTPTGDNTIQPSTTTTPRVDVSQRPTNVQTHGNDTAQPLTTVTPGIQTNHTFFPIPTGQRTDHPSETIWPGGINVNRTTTTSSPSEVTQTQRCTKDDYEKMWRCDAMISNLSIAFYGPASTAAEYSSNLCRMYKVYYDCISAVKSVCLVGPYTFYEMYSSMCLYEGRCRLADTGSFCFARHVGINPMATDSYGKICREKLPAVDECANRTMAEAGCSPLNSASAMWSFQRLVHESRCYILAAGNNDTCVKPWVNCLGRHLFNIPEAINDKDYNRICSESKAILSCMQDQMPNLPDTDCDAVSQYAIQMTQSLSPFCHSCYSVGNTYSVVPNTGCKQYKQSTNGDAMGKIQACPLGTVFDVKSCACNFPSFVSCDV